MPLAISVQADIPAPSGARLLPNYDRVLGESASTFAWWVPDAAWLTLVSGLVSNWNSRRAGGPALTQATAGVRPTPGADSSILGRPYLRFTGSNALALASFPAGLSSSWSKLMVLRRHGAGIPKAASLLTSANSAGRHLLQLSATTGNMTQTVGSPTAVATTITPPSWADWRLVVATWDHLTGTGGLYASNLSPSFTTAVNAAGSGATLTTATLGGAGDVDYAAVAVDSVALHLPANATKLAWWKQWTRDRFGMSVL